MLVLASEMQDHECGDATNLVVVFGGELLVQAEPLIRMGLHPSEIVSGYKKAGKKATEILETLVCSSIANIRDEEEVAKYLRPVISSKQFGYETFLGGLVAKACVAVLSPDEKFNVDNVRSVKILGGGVVDSSLIKGFVIARAPEGTVRMVKNAKVAVFATGIDANKTETKGTVRMTTADQLTSFSAGEEAFIEKIIDEIRESGAQVLVSGGAVSEMAMHYIERAGMLVVKINSKFDLRRLCNAVGATPLVRLGKPLPEEMGSCSVVRTEEIGSTLVTVFEQADVGDAKSKLATLVLRGSSPSVLDDFERAVGDAVSAFKTFTRDQRFVAGAGAAEMELAKQLRALGEANATMEQYAILKFAEALEVVPRILLDNSGVDSTHAVASLVAAHQKGQSSAGVNVETGAIADADTDLQVYDSLLSKKWAFQLAVDAAVTILRVDQLIVARAAGGPKPPAMGPMDAD